MKRLWFPLTLALLFPVAGQAQEEGAAPDTPGAQGNAAPEGELDPNHPLAKLKWSVGPALGQLGSQAEVKVPEGFRFVGAQDTRTLLEAFGNTTSGRELGWLEPLSGEWFVVFEFDESGYVKDDEKDELDPDAILDSIKEGNEAANEVKKERGWPTLEIVGWETKPSYNAATHNLEWAVRARSEAGESVNHNVRILGRAGVMEATLVTGPELLQASLPPFRGILTGFDYVSGQRYAEYKEGDKLAEYGLVALVAGGAAAGAAKMGLFGKLFKGLGKLIVVAVAAVGGLLSKLFGRKNNA